MICNIQKGKIGVIDVLSRYIESVWLEVITNNIVFIKWKNRIENDSDGLWDKDIDCHTQSQREKEREKEMKREWKEIEKENEKENEKE